MRYYNKLIKDIKSKNATICIVGLGYVGLPLLINFSKQNFNLIGYDKDKKKISVLKKAKSYISNITDNEIENLRYSKKIKFTSSQNEITNADVIICCLPTPITKNFSPDMSYINNFSILLNKYLRKGQLIILESTTYPGTTEDYILSVCKNKKFKIGKDIFIGYSPEREDPGNHSFTLSNTPKVISGYSRFCLKLLDHLYSKVSNETVKVSSLKTAEAVKIYENIFRSINISLANEMHIILSRLNIDIYEVIEAAKTKPFGFMPFYPGPCLGGHCIPIDPHLINWVSKENGYSSKFIDISAEINQERVDRIFNFITSHLFKMDLKQKNIRILIIGVAYKKNTNDCRESPALKFIDLLEKFKINYDFYDPFVKKLNFFRMYGAINKKSIINLDNINKYTCTLILTDHDKIDYNLVIKSSKMIFDTRGVYKFKKNKKIVKLSF